MAPFDVHSILESLEAFDLDYSKESAVRERITHLATDFNLDEDSLGDTIVAFALNNKKKIINIELLELLEPELIKEKSKSLKEKEAASKKKSEIKNSVGHQNVKSADEGFSEINTDYKEAPLLGPYACFSPVQSATSDTQYVQRKNSGEVVVIVEGKKYSSRVSNGKASIEVISPTSDGFYGNDKSAAIIEAKSERLSEFAALFTSVNPQVTTWTTRLTPSTDVCYVYGEVVRDKNENFNEGSIYLQLNDENGRILPVDIRNMKRVTVFPGAIVAFSGTNPTGNVFEAVEQLVLPPLPSCSLGSVNLDGLKIWIAAGPFTSSYTFSYEPMYDLLQRVKKEEPHVLILMGPFVDRKAKILSDPSFNEEPTDILTTLISKIVEELQTCKTDLIFQASPMRDTCSMGFFPSTPMSPDAHNPRAFKGKVNYIADPAIIDISGVRIALTGSEIIPHLSKAECHRSDNSDPPSDRIGRLAHHILEQRSLYPLYPSGLPTSLLDTLNNAKMTSAPHILVLPSVLPPSIKISNETVICNPGFILKGKSGTFLSAEIDLQAAKATSNLADSSLFKISRI